MSEPLPEMRRQVAAQRRRLSRLCAGGGLVALQVVRDYHRRTQALLGRLSGAARDEAQGHQSDEVNRYLGDAWDDYHSEWRAGSKLGSADAGMAAGLAWANRHAVQMAEHMGEDADADRWRWLSLRSQVYAMEVLCVGLEASQ